MCHRLTMYLPLNKLYTALINTMQDAPTVRSVAYSSTWLTGVVSTSSTL